MIGVDAVDDVDDVVDEDISVVDVVVDSAVEDTGDNVVVGFIDTPETVVLTVVAAVLVNDEDGLVVCSSTTELFLTDSSKIIVIRTVVKIIAMLKTAQICCPRSKYFQNPNIIAASSLCGQNRPTVQTKKTVLTPCLVNKNTP